MGTLNKIPKTGTFGTAVDAMNDNFTLIEQSLAEGYSPYQVWLDQGNEGTEQDFLDSLKGDPGTYIDPANVEIFSSLSSLEGKTTAEKQAMIPDGNAVESIIYKWRQMSASSLTFESVYVSSSGVWTDGTIGNGNGGVFLAVSAGDEIKLVADNALIYSVLKNNNHVVGQQASFATGYSGRVIVPVSGGTAEDTFVVPSDAKYIYICTLSSGNAINVDIYRREEIVFVETRTIQPLFTFDYIGGLTGDFSVNKTNFENGKNIATPRFIKTSEKFTFRADKIGTLQVYLYDEDFAFIQVLVYTYATANTDFVFDYLADYSYIKLVFQQSIAFVKSAITLTGPFDDDWDVFNTLPNNGYHKLSVMVNVSDAHCCDATTDSVQDSLDLRPNYGVIALPQSYSVTGKPTRLIIYCHGAGTHFTFDNSTEFDTDKHVDPAYWLAEGYAVMDVDGNPMDGDAHAFRPQAMDSYIAAYKWAIEHYNLYKDGVLLGGRSMGGGNTMYLLRSTCPIPVIAACANLPTSVAMEKTASAKLSIANMRGFVIPSGFTFSAGAMTDADTQVYYDNWDKAIRYIPSIALCADTPTTEEWKKNFIKNCCHVGEPYETNRIAACKDLHMIVRAPLKMFGCFEDPNNGYQATAQLYMTMLSNAGQQAEYRLFHSDKATNYPSDSRSEHYYELADPTLRTTVTTIYGEEMTDVPIVYVEMLQFWRRYEQNQ